MIIRQLRIAFWRGVEYFECALEPGLNLLKGPNEAGKSSIVEAVGWALHRDLIGGERLKNEISALIPANNLKARPQVELWLEFPTCTATIRKTLAEDSSSRECVLIVRREGRADERFDYGEAQTQLKKLMAGDGEVENQNTLAALEGDLLLSPQGASTHFVGRELSAAARAAANSLAVGEGGVLAPTSRLEKVRRALEKQRSKELFERLKTNAVDAAKKQTEAARRRDELAALRAAHAKYAATEAQIAGLRATIENLKSELAGAEPRVAGAERELQALRARHTAQMQINSEVAEKRRAHDEALQKRNELARRVEEIGHCKNELARAEHELQAARAARDAAQSGLDELQARQDAAWQENQRGEAAIQDAQQKAAAWSLAYEVCVAHRERSRARRRLEQLEAAQTELKAAEAELNGAGQPPARRQIQHWREQYSALQSAWQASAHSIRLALRLQRGVSLQWQSDGGQVQTGDAPADEEFCIGGAQTISVVVPGVGCLEVAGEDKEARKQAADLDAKRRHLENQIKSFGINWDDLPHAFEELENRSEAHERAVQNRQMAEQRWQSTLGMGEPLEDARAAFSQWDTQRKTAREKFDALRATLPAGVLPDGIKEMTALRERDRWLERESEARRQHTRAQKNWQATFADLNDAQNRAHQAQTQITVLEESANRASQRLAALQNEDGEDDADRAHHLDDLNAALYEAKIARDAAIRKREGLGGAITEEDLAHAAHEAEIARSELHHLQTELATRRVELRSYCEQDPQTELDRLDFEIAEAETEVARHEARLRGLGVLDAALEAERHRLGKELSTPINQFLSPWLSALRGKETHLEFDENGGRIRGVRSTDTHAGGNGSPHKSTHVLPFHAHSGGMQEQTALVLRLILARFAAQKLPSGRLPIVLDDPLTQTDTTRREGLWRVLREASAHLQILFVTCHESHLPAGDAHHIVLGDWRQTPPSVPPPSEEPNPEESKADEPKTRRAKKEKPRTQSPKSETEQTDTPTLSLW